jgi:iron complex outermembrane receptor protein
LTADAYIVRIDDRGLTDQFSRPSGTFAAGTPRELQLQFDLAGANAATFCQCYYTESKGIDIIVTHKLNLGAIVIKSDLATTFLKQDKWVRLRFTYFS